MPLSVLSSVDYAPLAVEKNGIGNGFCPFVSEQIVEAMSPLPFKRGASGDFCRAQ